MATKRQKQTEVYTAYLDLLLNIELFDNVQHIETTRDKARKDFIPEQLRVLVNKNMGGFL